MLRNIAPRSIPTHHARRAFATTGSATGPVLVVGGSLVGLSAAVFLRGQRVPTVLVEPHTASSQHPRAIGYTQRTLELFRAAGLADQIPQAPAGFRLLRRRVTALTGEVLEEIAWSPPKGNPSTGNTNKASPPPNKDELSPCSGAAIAQDRLEPILRNKARAMGCDLRLGTRLERFEQDEHGVTAHLSDANGANPSTLRVPYMLACDGHRSAVREALGITRSGRGIIRVVRSAIFRETNTGSSRLQECLKDGVHQFEVDQGDFKAFVTTYNDGRWLIVFGDDGQAKDADAMRASIQRAVGLDVPVEILATGQWDIGALVADRFSAGRVFLAGDAAHALPPNRAGFGANTGIHDAHNLAWKLAQVLQGVSSPALLDSYHAERWGVAWQRLLQIFLRPDYGRFANGIADGARMYDDDAMELGQIYRSFAIQQQQHGIEVEAARPSEWRGMPGTRFPHYWVQHPGGRASTLDLLNPMGWTLVLGGAAETGQAWRSAAALLGQKLWLTVTVLAPGAEFTSLSTHPAEEWPELLGITPGGALLVRPDGHVAWRFERLVPAAEFENALRMAAAVVSEH